MGGEDGRRAGRRARAVRGSPGGETGEILTGLLESLPGERRLVETSDASGCYVIDRRAGERRVIASAVPGPPSRHELDSLFSLACATALESRVLVVCNPYPAEALPLDVYPKLVTDAKRNGVEVLVDLSPPRLDRAIEGQPDVVKLTDPDVVIPADVRRRANKLDSVGLRLGGHRNAVGDVRRPVINAGEDVAVEVDHTVTARS